MAGTLITLYTFTGQADGAYPIAGPSVTAHSTVFGAASAGGDTCVASDGTSLSTGCGTIFRLGAGMMEHTLALFNGQVKGRDPVSSLTIRGDQVYGSTFQGSTSDFGLIFKVTNQGKNFQVLHRFVRTDGAEPVGKLRFDVAGNMYGVTAVGGQNNAGVLFRITPSNAYSILHDFTGKLDGISPTSIVISSSGVIYGAAASTSNGECILKHGVPSNGCGNVFSFSTTTNVFTIIHAFSGRYDGEVPSVGGVNKNGAIFGAAYEGGRYRYGTIFELRPDAAGYTFKLLHSFTGGADGAYPLAPYVALHGEITGVTEIDDVQGHSAGFGTLFSFANGALSVLHTFTGKADGGVPEGTPDVDSEGNIYGSASVGGMIPCHSRSGVEISSQGCGTIWKYTP